MAIGGAKPNTQLDPMGQAQGRVFRFTVESDAEVIQDQLKRGRNRRFEILCDEPQWLGGLDAAPTPLAYFSLALLF
ncbi:MAG: hypothetical protein FJ320_10750 [SAR202 cluster bacterium]|nr:hypothetical protein [SAR202 cluster bacterium]